LSLRPGRRSDTLPSALSSAVRSMASLAAAVLASAVLAASVAAAAGGRVSCEPLDEVYRQMQDVDFEQGAANWSCIEPSQSDMDLPCIPVDYLDRDLPLPVCSEPKERMVKQAPYGCCTGNFDNACSKTNCACDASSYPQQSLVGWQGSPGEARALLAGKKVVFAGDSTTRRLFYALCSFLAEVPFWDRHGAIHQTLTCPEVHFRDQLVGESKIALSFFWAPMAQSMGGNLQQYVRGVGPDFFVTSIYHHDRFNLHTPRADFLTKFDLAVGGLQQAAPSANVIVVAPNLVDHLLKEYADVNQDILALNKELRETFAGKPQVSVVGTEWMREGPDSVARDPCIGDTGGPGIHVRYQEGQYLRMRSALWAIARPKRASGGTVMA